MTWARFKLHTGDPRELPNAPDAPPWRSFAAKKSSEPRTRAWATKWEDPRASRTLTEAEKSVVHAALILRRPLLVEGDPGSGKSSLAYAIAREFMLGPVIKWEVRSRTTLEHGLYAYDALARLQAAQLAHLARDAKTPPIELPGVDHYIALGPLGTALYPHDAPRMLLVDEIDKGDLDLPGDLLHSLEEGAFDIPEIHRDPGTDFTVRLCDDPKRHAVPADGRVHCGAHFPVVVITSNQERTFPPAFLRRCIRWTARVPSDEEQLKAILGQHFTTFDADALVKRFAARVGHEMLAADQLLNAVFLKQVGLGGDGLVALHHVEAALDVPVPEMPPPKDGAGDS